jgi:hypothetical protein
VANTIASKVRTSTSLITATYNRVPLGYHDDVAKGVSKMDEQLGIIMNSLSDSFSNDSLVRNVNFGIILHVEVCYSVITFRMMLFV